MPLKINPQHISCLSQHVRLKMKDSCLVKTRSHLCTRAIIWVVTGTKAGAVPERGLQAPELWHWNSSCSLVISWLLHPFLDRAYTFFGFNTELRPACPDIYHLTLDFGFSSHWQLFLSFHKQHSTTANLLWRSLLELQTALEILSAFTSTQVRTREPSSANIAAFYSAVHPWPVKLNIFTSRNSLLKAAIPSPSSVMLLRCDVCTRPSPGPHPGPPSSTALSRMAASRSSPSDYFFGFAFNKEAAHSKAPKAQGRGKIHGCGGGKLAFAAAAAASLQSCLTLCDPIDGSPPGSPIPGSLQARTLEWVAISFSNAWKWKVKVKSLSHVRPSATPWTAADQAPPPKVLKNI